LPRTSRRRFAHEQGRLREPRLDRAIEELDQRCHRCEHLEELGIKAAARGERRFVLARAEELLELQVVRGWMILGIAKRHAGQSIARQFADRSRECRCRHHRVKTARMGRGNLRANVVQIGGRRHVHAAAHPHPTRRNLEVEAGAFALRHAAQRKARRDVRLVRRLVAAEARVAVDTKQRDLWIGDQLRREPSQVDRELLEQRDHRCAHVRLVFVLARLEPLTPVVALERAQKRECLSRKRRGHVSDHTFRR